MTLSFVALNFETANAANDRACSIGLVKVENSRVVAQVYRLINPEVPIWWYFTKKVHGLGDRDVQDEPCFDKVWKSLRPLLKGADFIAAHNAPFDRRVLYSCCEYYGLKVPSHDFICTCSLSKKSLDLGDYKLPTVCDCLKIKVEHHNAMSDALACAKVLLKLKKYL